MEKLSLACGRAGMIAKIFTPQRHKVHKEELIKLCVLCAFVVKFGCLMALPALGGPLGQNGLADSLKYHLVKNGFENVAVVLEDRHVIVTYENRIYRHEIRAAQEVMALLASLLKEGMKITLIPQNRKIPLVAISLSPDDYPALANGKASHSNFFSRPEVSLDVDPVWKKVRALPKANSSSWKFDLVVHPQVKAQFGKRSDPVESQINLAPELNVLLWKGMSISAQWIIPLQNQLVEEGGPASLQNQHRKEGNFTRPGLLTLNQIFRAPKNTVISATLGYFTQHRYGADTEIKKHFFNGRASLGANLGYTGYAAYLKGVWSYSTIDLITALVNAECRLSRFDLSLRATYGKFLERDKGWRIDIRRQFSETDIGFFVSNTGAGTNGGFNFSLPIFPSKHLPPGPIRARTASYFPWEYRYWGDLDSATRYNTGNPIEAFMKRLNPDYIKNQW